MPPAHDLRETGFTSRKRSGDSFEIPTNSPSRETTSAIVGGACGCRGADTARRVGSVVVGNRSSTRSSHVSRSSAPPRPAPDQPRPPASHWGMTVLAPHRWSGPPQTLPRPRPTSGRLASGRTAMAPPDANRSARAQGGQGERTRTAPLDWPLRCRPPRRDPIRLTVSSTRPTATGATRAMRSYSAGTDTSSRQRNECARAGHADRSTHRS